MAYDRDPAGQTHRGAFFRCFLASFLLVLVAAGACVYFNAVDRQLFETALLENVDYAALGMDADSMRSFAEETILFLTDAQDSWEPSITVAGFPASRFIPQNFRDHMVTVKGWVSAASTLLVCGTVAAVALAGLGAGHLWPPGRIFNAGVLRRNDSAAAAHCRGGLVGQPGFWRHVGDAAPHAYPRRHFPRG